MEKLISEYFVGDLEALKANVKRIANGSFDREWTLNYSLNMNTAYNRLIEYAIEVRALGYLITKTKLIRKFENDRRNNQDVISIAKELINILDINEK